MQRDDFRDDLPVSRGQWRALALSALRVLDEEAPRSRMDATELLVRFQRGEAEVAQPAPVALADARAGAR
jgi:hypothetical protein